MINEEKLGEPGELGRPYRLEVDGRIVYLEIEDRRLKIVDSDFPDTRLRELSRETATYQLAARNSPG